MKARLVFFAILALAPPVALVLFGGAQFSWIVKGAVLWAASVLLKVILGIPISLAFSEKRRSSSAFAALWGSWSALCELGVVAVYFLFISRPAFAVDVIGVGLGVGSAEVLFIVRGGWLALLAPSKLLPSEPPGDWFAAWSGVFERASTSVGHAATRGLVWAGLGGWPLAPFAAFGFLTFALVDGIATYGTARGWDWKEPRLARRFNTFLAVIALLEAAAFVFVVRLKA